jgi:hypothetical protein
MFYNGKEGMFTPFKRESGLVYYFQEGKWASLLRSIGKLGLFTIFKRESGLVYYFQEGKWASLLLQEGKMACLRF